MSLISCWPSDAEGERKGERERERERERGREGGREEWKEGVQRGGGGLTASEGGDVNQVQVWSFLGHNAEAVWPCW